MKHLQGPTVDGYYVLQWESAWVDFFFTGQSVGMLSNTMICSVFGTIIHTRDTRGTCWEATCVHMEDRSAGSSGLLFLTLEL